MRTGICINHRDRSASEHCHTCHKPICSECVKRVGSNIFCSQACAENYANFHAKFQSERPSLIGKLIKFALVLAVLAGAGLFIGAKVLHIGSCVEWLKKFGL